LLELVLVLGNCSVLADRCSLVAGDHHHPRIFHHVNPSIAHVGIVSNDATNPIRHHSRCVT
jgi:hypothetical protein